MTRTKAPAGTLRLRRVFHAARERVFRAWTTPEDLRKWWRLGKGWTTAVASVNLRVGGEFQLGVKPPGEEAVHLVRGVFREVNPPAKLVYTWVVQEGLHWSQESLVTVEFQARGSSTVVLLTHQHLAEKQLHQTTLQGWTGVLGQLRSLLAGPPRARHRDTKPNG